MVKEKNLQIKWKYEWKI